MNEDEIIVEYFRRVERVTKMIKRIYFKFEDEVIIQKILRSLPTRFNPKVYAIEEMCDLSTLTKEKCLEFLQPMGYVLLKKNLNLVKIHSRPPRRSRPLQKKIKKLPNRIKEE